MMTRSPDLRTLSKSLRYEKTSPPVLALIRTSANPATEVISSNAAAQADRCTSFLLAGFGLAATPSVKTLDDLFQQSSARSWHAEGGRPGPQAYPASPHLRGQSLGTQSKAA